MKTRTTMDSGGRIVIPKQVREALHLVPGDSLEVSASGDDILIRPVRAAASLVKERGIWVYHAETPASDIDICALIDQSREQRIGEIAG